MNKYELAIVLNPNMNEEAIEAELLKLQTMIEKFDGVIDKVDKVGKRRLAYPIKKLTDGVYNFITFSGPASIPSELESRLRIMENILRYLIVRDEK